MTLSQIMTLALRQLDEDPEDISEYDELFRAYANMGYRIAVNEYVKPRDLRSVRSDDYGVIRLEDNVRRVVSLEHVRKGERMRRNVMFDALPAGNAIRTGYADATFVAVCEIDAREMENANDEPVFLPSEAHAAIADYICYRHLLNGNMAKQARGEQYRSAFYEAMQRICPDGAGSVKTFRNLYEATGIR